jgi:signal recognition particle subunit SRP54
MFDLLKDAFTKLKRELLGRGSLSEKEIKEFLRSLRVMLLEADVNYKAAKAFISSLEEKLNTTEIYSSLQPGKQALRVIYDELTAFLGGKVEKLEFAKPPTLILLLGLQGVGKTTMAAKLAKMHASKHPLLVAADIKRPAAVEQLESLAKKAKVDFLGPPKTTSRDIETCTAALKHAKKSNNELVIIDSAGRLHIDEEMVAELAEIKAKLSPAYTLLVLDGLVGQDALRQTQEFHAQLGVSGAILTKLDGDARGGAALSFRHVTGLPIYFIGVGERLDDLEVFHPDRIAARILGEGDIVSVAEQVRQVVDERSSAELAEKLIQGRLNFEDLLDQMKQLSKMGDLSKLLEKLPAGMMGGMSAEDFDPAEIKRTEAIILSMTPEERRNPDILSGSRKLRIAKGSGTSPSDVNQLIKQLEMMQGMAKGAGVDSRMMGAGKVRMGHGGKKKQRKKKGRR